MSGIDRAVRRRKKKQWTADDVFGILTNPVYVGLGPYPQIVDEETWVRCVSKLIGDEGPERVLRLMLRNLRQVFPVLVDEDQAEDGEAKS